MNRKFKLIAFCILPIFVSSPAFSKIKLPPKSESVSNEATKCVPKKNGNRTLVLIDATDALKPGQVEFVKDNFVKNFDWKSEGDSISYVVLHDKPVQLMNNVILCAPKPEKDIDMITDHIAKIKYQNRKFRKDLLNAFQKIVDRNSKEKSERTLLVEAITEIYRNRRYHFTTGKSRDLILISDLYQHSEIISFFEMCEPKGHGDRPLTCPGFSETLSENSRFNNYVERAKPNLKGTDKVKVYYLNVDGRVDRSAESWWTEYFSKSGLSEGQLEIIPELQ